MEGVLVIDEEYLQGLEGVEPGQRIFVIFDFHRSPEFVPRFPWQTPPHREKEVGVVGICSPVRPTPVGMSVPEVLKVEGASICVKRLDMLDDTLRLDIKPYTEDGFQGSVGISGGRVRGS